MFSKAKSNGKTSDAKSGASASLLDAPAPQVSTQTSAGGKRAGGSTKMAGVPSIISADVVMQGNINSAGEIQFDGTIEGDLKAASLIIGEHASVRGEVVCETVTVRGRVEGAIRARSVSLASTAHIQGDILHSSLSVETGAHFEGNCRHSDDPLSETAAKDFRRGKGGPAPSPRPVSSEASLDDDDRRAANEAPSFLSSARSPLR